MNKILSQIFGLHEYQEELVDFCVNTPKCGLFLQMGLGKTRIALATVCELVITNRIQYHCLVIAPKAIARSSWIDEMNKIEIDIRYKSFLIDEKGRELTKAKRELLFEEAKTAPPTMYFISRDLLSQMVKYFGKEWCFPMLIVDEYQSFKNPDSKRTESLLNVMPYTERMIGLTGTPAPNGLDDLWSLIAVLDEYCPNDSHRPDNAVTLIDRAVANAVIEKYKLLNNPDINLQNMGRSINGINLSKRGIIRTALKIATGHNEPRDFSEDGLRSELGYIKGQDNVLEQIIEILKLRNMHIRPMNQPLTFLFTGSSGVGKTEVTNIIARYCADENPIKLNMAEFYSEAGINRLIGAPAGYVGYDSNAEMPFDILDTNPYQVIELNEFDQAHKSVQDLFMNVFEEGYLKNNNGKIIDFSKSIIIATTNAGRMNISNPIGLNRKKQGVSVAELSEYFKIALINRFNHKLTFNDITRETYGEIMKGTYSKEVRMIKQTKPGAALEDELPDTVLKVLCDESYDVRLGARPVKTTIYKYIDSRLMEG